MARLVPHGGAVHQSLARRRRALFALPAAVAVLPAVVSLVIVLQFDDGTRSSRKHCALSGIPAATITAANSAFVELLVFMCRSSFLFAWRAFPRRNGLAVGIDDPRRDRYAKRVVSDCDRALRQQR